MLGSGPCHRLRRRERRHVAILTTLATGYGSKELSTACGPRSRQASPNPCMIRAFTFWSSSTVNSWFIMSLRIIEHDETSRSTRPNSPMHL
jgi:hypothetical protein